MSLARLWQQQGKKDAARQMLAEIYGWFTEGFDTKDVQEARALLEELAGQKPRRQREQKAPQRKTSAKTTRSRNKEG